MGGGAERRARRWRAVNEKPPWVKIVRAGSAAAPEAVTFLDDQETPSNRFEVNPGAFSHTRRPAGAIDSEKTLL